MNLLNKTILYYLVFSVIVYAIGGILIYRLVNIIVIGQMSKSLMFEEQLIEDKLLSFEKIPKFNTTPDHIVDVKYSGDPLRQVQMISDTMIDNPYTKNKGNYLYIRESGSIPDSSGFYRGYTITIYRSLADTRSLLSKLILIIWLVFLMLIIVLGLFNFWISRRMWRPFYDTIDKISNYNIHDESKLVLMSTGIQEFSTLNSVLTTMSDKITKNYNELKELTEDITHEIQTPVTIIKSKFDLLLQPGDLSTEQIKHLSSISEAAGRLSRLNHTLNLISEKNTNNGRQTETVDVYEIIDSFLNNFNDLLKEKNLTVTRQIESKPKLMIKYDLAFILISNLLGNAIKHNIQNGTIRIEVNQSSLTIKNTGPSPDRKPEELFERFKKSGHSVNSLGLGLSIIRKIVQLNDMQINYTTEDNLHTFKLFF